MHLFDLRKAAVEAVGRLGAPEGVKTLVRLLPRSNQVLESDLDCSFCESTIAALINIIQRVPNDVSVEDLTALAEWPDTEFKGWDRPNDGHYSVKGRLVRVDCGRLRDAARTARRTSRPRFQ
jgi:HEAT repeat protein